MMTRCAIILLCIMYVFQKTECNMIKSKPVVDVRKLSPCDDFENIILLYAKITRWNSTMQAATGNITLQEDLDATYKVRATVSRLINDVWHKDISISKNDPCRTLKTILGPIANQLLAAIHVKNCPVRKGRYSVTDFPLDVHAIPLIYATGLFKLEIELFKKPNTRKLCYVAEAMITLED